MPGSQLIKDYATAIRASLARAVTAQLDLARACSGSKIAPMGSEQPRSNLAPMMLTSGDGAETKKTGAFIFRVFGWKSRVAGFPSGESCTWSSPGLGGDPFGMSGGARAAVVMPWWWANARRGLVVRWVHRVQQHQLGTWCSGITSAPHAEGPGFKSQCVHCYDWPGSYIHNMCEADRPLQLT